ncbi:MAG TPA: hypothetical protein VGK28_11010 [Candidatus Dormibacteraeota bacterium]|jgi:hypothetical protein
MNKRPGHVTVATEVGYCSFCGRPRNLRSEAHHLGTLVRTIVTCETCHRTLSSTVGVASDEPVELSEPAAPLPAAARPTSPASEEVKKRKTPAARKPTATKTAAKAPAKRATTKKK